MSNQKKRSRSAARAKEIWRRYRKNRLAMAGLVIFFIILMTAVFADVIVPYEAATKTSASERLQSPNAEHWLGTDGRGRDVFARIVHGAPSSLMIGFIVAAATLVIGGFLGLACGYFGGRFDTIIMRILDMISALPGDLLAIVMVAVLGPNMQNLIIALIIGRIAGTARMARSVALNISAQEYVEAARCGGSRDLRNILVHALPNAAGTLIIDTTMSISIIILSASSLSFIGLGVQPPRPEWGAMLNDAREYFRTAPHLMIFPGLSILLTAISMNMIGDGLRDALDPKLKN